MTVKVEKESIRQAECVGYEDGLTLDDVQTNIFSPSNLDDMQTYIFSPSNWNLSQTVQIIMQPRNQTFQGTSITRFKHRIESTDPVWKSAFVRPMTVTIAGDDECNNGAEKYDEFVAGATIRKCGCMEGYYVTHTDPNYCGSVTACGKCPPGMLCDSLSHPSGQLLEEAVVKPKWYRLHNSSTNVVPCPKPSTQCTGDGTHGDQLCKEGHEGPFCMICALGDNSRHVRSGDECVKCSGGSIAQLYLAGILAVLFSVCVVLFLKRGKTKRRPNPGNKSSPSMPMSESLSVFAEKVQSKYKVGNNDFHPSFVCSHYEPTRAGYFVSRFWSPSRRYCPKSPPSTHSSCQLFSLLSGENLGSCLWSCPSCP